MDLNQVKRIYKTYNKHPDMKVSTETFLQVTETLIKTLKQVKKIVESKNKEIEELKRANK